MTDPDTTDEPGEGSRLLHTSVARLAVEIRGVQTNINGRADLMGCQSAATIDEVATPTATETQVALQQNRLELAEYEQLAESIIDRTTGVEREKMIATSYIHQDDQLTETGSSNRYTPRLYIIFDTSTNTLTREEVSSELASRFHLYDMGANNSRIIAVTDVAFLDSLGDIPHALGVSQRDITLAAKAVEESDDTTFVWNTDE